MKRSDVDGFKSTLQKNLPTQQRIAFMHMARREREKRENSLNKSID